MKAWTCPGTSRTPSALKPVAKVEDPGATVAVIEPRPRIPRTDRGLRTADLPEDGSHEMVEPAAKPPNHTFERIGSVARSLSSRDA